MASRSLELSEWTDSVRRWLRPAARALGEWVLSHALPPREIPISSCVHYAGFRYGGEGYHPYETYLRRLVVGESVAGARRELLEFIRSYRPADFAEALGIEGMTRSHALWAFPWDPLVPWLGSRGSQAWISRPEKSPDILTHFCAQGVLSYQIEEEFVWLERALRSIEQEGYQPQAHGFALALKLSSRDGRHSYLLRDGNHRVAALSALGERRVKVQCLPWAVDETWIERWSGVRSGEWTEEDARRLFLAYLAGNRWKPCAARAAIIAPRGWEDLYS